jgi:hypothetical protein
VDESSDLLRESNDEEEEGKQAEMDHPEELKLPGILKEEAESNSPRISPRRVHTGHEKRREVHVHGVE